MTLDRREIHQILLSGGLEDEVDLTPLDRLTIIDTRTSKNIHQIFIDFSILSRPPEIWFKIYLNERGKEIVSFLNQYNKILMLIRRWSGRISLLFGFMALISIAQFPIFSAFAFIISSLLAPVRITKIEGRIGAHPILVLSCSNCGFEEGFQIESKEEINELKDHCPSCGAESDEVRTTLIGLSNILKNRGEIGLA